MVQPETANARAIRLRVLGLHQAGFPVPAIAKKMKAEGFPVSRSDVAKILATATKTASFPGV